MRTHIISTLLLTVVGLSSPAEVKAVSTAAMTTTDSVKPKVQLHYVNSFEEAILQAKREGKLIFFNCYANWATPCRSMDEVVFSNEAFGQFMNKNFVNLLIEMTSEEGKALATRYNVNKFAHYLVLNDKGEVLLRIVGGKPLPAFQEDLSLALNPKTTLPATEAEVAKGKPSKKVLSTFLRVHQLALDTAAYNMYLPQYWAMLKESEYTKAENWQVFTRQLNSTSSSLFSFFLKHKDEFAKESGEGPVNTFLQRLFYNDLEGYAFGSESYNADAMLSLFMRMQEAGLSEKSFAYALYQVTKLRGTGKLEELLTYLRANGEQLEQLRPMFESYLPSMSLVDSDKPQLAAYLKERAQQTKGSASRMLSAAAAKLEEVPAKGGMVFTHTDFQSALQQAKQAGKLVFLDCFTTWCMPCKMMSDRVFPQEEVGAYMNPRFVNIKIDMERGEGVELAKRYGVQSYPTMLILNADGKEVGRLVGASAAPNFIQRVKDALSEK